jgi:hypothetical protein
MTAYFILPDGSTDTEIYCSGAQTPRLSAERIVWMESEIERLRLRNDELYAALQKAIPMTTGGHSDRPIQAF